MQPLDNVKYWRDPVLPGLTVAYFHEFGHCFPNHIHDYYAVGVMESGRSYCLGANREPVDAGQL